MKEEDSKMDAGINNEINLIDSTKNIPSTLSIVRYRKPNHWSTANNMDGIDAPYDGRCMCANCNLALVAGW